MSHRDQDPQNPIHAEKSLLRVGIRLKKRSSASVRPSLQESCRQTFAPSVVHLDHLAREATHTAGIRIEEYTDHHPNRIEKTERNHDEERRTSAVQEGIKRADEEKRKPSSPRTHDGHGSDTHAAQVQTPLKHDEGREMIPREYGKKIGPVKQLSMNWKDHQKDSLQRRPGDEVPKEAIDRGFVDGDVDQQSLRTAEQILIDNNNEDLRMIAIRNAVIEYAQRNNETIHSVQALARRIIVRCMLRHLIPMIQKYLEVASCHPLDFSSIKVLKPTSGVSYVIQSESKQLGARGHNPLPHIVIRPPLAPLLTDRGIERDTMASAYTFADIFAHSKTTSVIFSQVRDENTMKSYLLGQIRRQDIVNRSGSSARVLDVNGASNVAPLLHDRSFICLHYILEGLNIEDAILRPCTAESVELQLEEGEVRESSHANRMGMCEDFLDASNVQVCIFVRKGIGGTCPIRAAAKKPGVKESLVALLEDFLPHARSSEPSQTTNSLAPHAPQLENIVGENIHSSNDADLDPDPCDSSGDQDDLESTEYDAHTQPNEHVSATILKTATLSCRLETFVQRDVWKNMDR